MAGASPVRSIYSRTKSRPRRLARQALILGLLLLAACAGLPPTPAANPAAPSPSPLAPTPASQVGEAVAPQATAALLPPSPSTLPPSLPTPSPTLPLPPPPPTSAPIRFAVIGDFGAANSPEAEVAALVLGWQPDFILTVGDNNYPNGAADTLDANVGQFYHPYIAPYTGQYGAGSAQNRFFPTLGNHDWNTASAQPYLDYFQLPNNERYYDFTWGPVHFFALDSDSREPDGVSSGSVQAEWLQAGLAAATEPWKIVFMHHPPYSSGLHGPVTWMRWPFKEWGADAVLAGHDHTYERLLVDGLPYFVDGLGGGSRYNFTEISEGSQVRYNADYGAMLVTASDRELTFLFANRQGETIDTYSIQQTP